MRVGMMQFGCNKLRSLAPEFEVGYERGGVRESVKRKCMRGSVNKGWRGVKSVLCVCLHDRKGFGKEARESSCPVNKERLIMACT